MGFILSIKDDGTVDVVKVSNCSLADIDGDYIFDTDNSLYRIQADMPISEDKYEEITECYKEHNSTPCDYGECPYNAENPYDCRNHCGVGVDE